MDFVLFTVICFTSFFGHTDNLYSKQGSFFLHPFEFRKGHEFTILKLHKNQCSFCYQNPRTSELSTGFLLPTLLVWTRLIREYYQCWYV